MHTKISFNRFKEVIDVKLWMGEDELDPDGQKAHHRCSHAQELIWIS